MYGPELNDGKHIFVFGSNRMGIHGRGAAQIAYKEWGACWWCGQGRHGQSYAIPTKDTDVKTILCLPVIKGEVDKFIKYANENPKLIFLVTAVGCGFAGYDYSDIAPMFVYSPLNCRLPRGWRNYGGLGIL